MRLRGEASPSTSQLKSGQETGRKKREDLWQSGNQTQTFGEDCSLYTWGALVRPILDIHVLQYGHNTREHCSVDADRYLEQLYLVKSVTPAAENCMLFFSTFNE